MPKRYPRGEGVLLERVPGWLILCSFGFCQELIGKWNRLVASGPVVRKSSLRPKPRKEKRKKNKKERSQAPMMTLSRLRRSGVVALQTI